MGGCFYHENPETLALETEVVAARPGAVALARIDTLLLGV